MRQREIEGLYSPTPDSAKESSSNYQMVGDGQVTIFSGGADNITPRD